MGLHRTLLFLLVVGLIIAAFRRSGGSPASVLPSKSRSSFENGPASAVPLPTNSTVRGGLAGLGREALK